MLITIPYYYTRLGYIYTLIWMPANVDRIIKPAFAYNLTIFLRYLASFPTLQLGTHSTVTNCIYLKWVKNSSPVTNITSSIRVTHLFSLCQSLGILTIVSISALLLGMSLVAAPFNLIELRRPMIDLALAMSLIVMGYFLETWHSQFAWTPA